MRDKRLMCIPRRTFFLPRLLESAGNSSLMTSEPKANFADHAASNYRVLMNLGDEVLAQDADRDNPRLNSPTRIHDQRASATMSETSTRQAQMCP
jgi:hypothetical protein